MLTILPWLSYSGDFTSRNSACVSKPLCYVSVTIPRKMLLIPNTSQMNPCRQWPLCLQVSHLLLPLSVSLTNDTIAVFFCFLIICGVWNVFLSVFIYHWWHALNIKHTFQVGVMWDDSEMYLSSQFIIFLERFTLAFPSFIGCYGVILKLTCQWKYLCKCTPDQTRTSRVTYCNYT